MSALGVVRRSPRQRLLQRERRTWCVLQKRRCALRGYIAVVSKSPQWRRASPCSPLGESVGMAVRDSARFPSLRTSTSQCRTHNTSLLRSLGPRIRGITRSLAHAPMPHCTRRRGRSATAASPRLQRRHRHRSARASSRSDSRTCLTTMTSEQCWRAHVYEEEPVRMAGV